MGKKKHREEKDGNSRIVMRDGRQTNKEKSKPPLKEQ
jgi:hypothetical protein